MQRSFDDLGTPLADTTFCVIDLETTGGDRRNDLITEVGVVKVRGGECLGTYHSLVNPGRAIPPRISVITGLTDAVVASAPRIEQVLPSLMRFLGDGVIVGHNVSFDLGVLRATLERAGEPDFRPVAVDTVALARRLVRDEVPDCRLATLASRFRLDHRPCHRALDDALATVDLLHLLIERASGFGVLGLDDLVQLAKLTGHRQAAKLDLTTHLPRTPGVYVFHGHRDEVLYVGKATNLRQRVRSYFGSDDRRSVAPMLRETERIRHVELADPLAASVVEQRMIAGMLPRYNRVGTRADKYCYVRLDVDSPWPRLSVVREPSAGGAHLGPLPSRANAQLIVDALHAAVPLRRCTTRLGRSFRPSPDSVPCASAQLGVSACPCAGSADRAAYDAAVVAATAALRGDTFHVGAVLTAKMAALAGQQRYEDAAVVRDRLAALATATRRHHLVEALRAAGRCEVRRGPITWVVDGARLVDVVTDGSAGHALPVPPPPPAEPGRPLRRGQIDEALCLARYFDRHAARLDIVACSGDWRFPTGVDDQLPRLELDRSSTRPTAAPSWSIRSTLV